MKTSAQLYNWLASQKINLPTFRCQLVAANFFLFLLHKLAESNDDTCVEDELRELLRKRAVFLKNRRIDYTNDPHSDINKLFLHIAHELAGPQEPVCLVLMPYLMGLCRESFDFKLETEDDNKFLPHHFLLKKNDTLIPIEEVYAHAENNPGVVDLQDKKNTGFPYFLNAKDLERLEQVAGECSIKYFKALRDEIQYRKKDSLGFHLDLLANALCEASVRGRGTEEEAHPNIAAAVVLFYESWVQLPVNEPINQLTLAHWGDNNYTLKDYLSALFVRYLDSNLVTDEERESVETHPIYPCAQQLSQAVKEFLRQHPNLFSVFITQPEPFIHAKSLSSLREKAVDALSYSRDVDDEEDREFKVHLVTFLLDVENKNILEDIANFVSELIENADELYEVVKKLGPGHVLLERLLPQLKPDIVTYVDQTLPKIISGLSINHQDLLLSLLEGNWLRVLRYGPFFRLIELSLDNSLRDKYLQAVAKEYCDATNTVCTLYNYYGNMEGCKSFVTIYLAQVIEKLLQMRGLEQLKKDLILLKNEEITLAAFILLSDKIWDSINNSEEFTVFFEKTTEFTKHEFIRDRLTKISTLDAIREALTKLPDILHKLISSSPRVAGIINEWIANIRSINELIIPASHASMQKLIWDNNGRELVELCSSLADFRLIMVPANERQQVQLLELAAKKLPAWRTDPDYLQLVEVLHPKAKDASIQQALKHYIYKAPSLDTILALYETPDDYSKHTHFILQHIPVHWIGSSNILHVAKKMDCAEMVFATHERAINSFNLLRDLLVQIPEERRVSLLSERLFNRCLPQISNMEELFELMPTLTLEQRNDFQTRYSRHQELNELLKMLYHKIFVDPLPSTKICIRIKKWLDTNYFSEEEVFNGLYEFYSGPHRKEIKYVLLKINPEKLLLNDLRNFFENKRPPPPSFSRLFFSYRRTAETDYRTIDDVLLYIRELDVSTLDLKDLKRNLMTLLEDNRRGWLEKAMVIVNKYHKYIKTDKANTIFDFEESELQRLKYYTLGI